MQTFGRKTIYVNFEEEEILKLPIEKQNKIIKDIIEDSKDIHELNKTETLYLKDYLKGIQDIYYEKQKFTRTEIDNKSVENWAWAFVDFKKCQLLGNPIQYVQINDSGEKEIALLNKYVRFENKKAKDMDCYEDVLVCGRGFIYKNYQKPTEDDEAPFELLNCEAENTEVVYSSKIGHKQVGSYIVSPMQYMTIVTDEITGDKSTKIEYYNEYTFYLRNRVITFNDKNGELQEVPNSNKTILLNEHIITEYYTNKYRLGIIEIGKDLFNDINYLESTDKDDMQQFTNAIMVFTNVEVTEEEIGAIKELGAVCISSVDNKKASIELLSQRLNASDTQVYYTRLLTSLHQILGVPMASDNGNLSRAETGKAVMTGQGYLSSSIRSEGDQTMYAKCDMEMLKGVLKACKLTPNPEIKTLKISDFEPKFFIDRSDNILTKTQALMNLYSCDIPRKFANSIIGLFGDANAITTEQERLFGEQKSQQQGSNNNEILEQNNDLKTTGEIDTQNQ